MSKNTEVVLTTREYFSKEYGCTMYVVSVFGGPQDLLARDTESGALEAGAAYVAEKWGRKLDGAWSPYPHECA